MKIGILYEGDYDQEPFSILLRHILKNFGQEGKPQFVPLAAQGNIEPKVEDGLKLFFEVTDPCNIAIFINDLDNKLERCKSIKRKVTKYKQKHPTIAVAVLCPDPCFEEWFFIEENALKKVLGLPMEEPIQYAGMHSKSRLEKLIYKFNDDYTKSKMDIYKEIAENLNIQSLATRNREFKKLLDFID
jgi:hypothetical protein